MPLYKNDPGKAQELLPFDRDAVSNVEMYMVRPYGPPENIKQDLMKQRESGYITDEVVRAQYDKYFKRQLIEFQFPPTISADSKSINWDLRDLKGYEPLAIFMGSKARNISVEFNYVLYGNEWNIFKIRSQLQKIKAGAYFGDFMGNGVGKSGSNAPYIKFVCYQVIPRADSSVNVGSQESTWRIDNSVSITYSNEKVNVPDVGIWPIHTNVKIGLSLVTNAASMKSPQGSLGAEYNRLNNLGRAFPLKVHPNWY